MFAGSRLTWRSWKYRSIRFCFWMAFISLASCRPARVPPLRGAQAGQVVSPAVTKKITENELRIAALERQIEAIESTRAGRLQEDRADLEGRMAREQQELDLIRQEMRRDQEVLIASQRADELKTNQEIQIADQELAGLRQKISAQEKLVAEAQARVSSAVGPDASDLMTSLKSQLAKEQERLAGLWENYSSVLERQRSAVSQAVQTQADRVREGQNRRMDLEVRAGFLDADLTLLKQELEGQKERVKSQIAEVEQLRAEKEKLAAENLSLRQSPQKSSG